MRKQIIETITAVGFDPEIFIVGNGAEVNFSTIHYRPYKGYSKADAEYSVQFCESVVAIWEIKERIKERKSIDLSWEGTQWRDVDELRIKRIRIQNSEHSTEAAVMPIECFESYLRLKACEIDNNDEYYINHREGDAVEIYSTRYERDAGLRKQAIEIHGTRCQACGFSFSKYGEIGEGYIEVHHIKPVSEGPRNVNPATDMVCLCSNCHRMIHRRRNRVLTIDELKTLITQE